MRMARACHSVTSTVAASVLVMLALNVFHNWKRVPDWLLSPTFLCCVRVSTNFIITVFIQLIYFRALLVKFGQTVWLDFYNNYSVLRYSIKVYLRVQLACFLEQKCNNLVIVSVLRTCDCCVCVLVCVCVCLCARVCRCVCKSRGVVWHTKLSKSGSSASSASCRQWLCGSDCWEDLHTVSLVLKLLPVAITTPLHYLPPSLSLLPYSHFTLTGALSILFSVP